MIVRDDKISIRKISNGYNVTLFKWNGDKDAWVDCSEYQFQDESVLLDFLMQHINSPKSVEESL